MCFNFIMNGLDFFNFEFEFSTSCERKSNNYNKRKRIDEKTQIFCRTLNKERIWFDQWVITSFHKVIAYFNVKQPPKEENQYLSKKKMLTMKIVSSFRLQNKKNVEGPRDKKANKFQIFVSWLRNKRWFAFWWWI